MNEFWIVITSFALTVLIGKFLIPELRKWHFGQSIRECGPKEHMKKSGTPTMGGIMMILAVIVACLMWIPFDPHIIVALWLFTGYGLIGFIDDGLKIFFKRNLGLTAKQKMALQILVAAVYLLYPGDVYSTKIWIPLVNASVDLGYFYPVFILLLLVGTTNAVNLTDGLDGLAVGVTIPVMLAFAAIENNDKVGLLFFSDRIEKFIPPKKGRKHILHLIRELLDFQPESNSTDITVPLEYITGAVKKRCTAFLLSDFIDPHDYMNALTIANRKHDIVAIRVYDRRMEELPDVGLMKLYDSESGQEMFVDTSSVKVRSAHKKWFDDNTARLQDYLTRSCVDSVSVRTDQDYVKALMGLFAKRN